MCGIVGILGREPVADELVEALKRLEYRGYDSAGVATLEGGHLTRRRAEGKLRNLEARLASEPLAGTIGIGHTRWATHGRPNESNAHPHATDRSRSCTTASSRISASCAKSWRQKGAKFGTETDTEVVAHLVTHEMKNGRSPAEAVAAALPRLRGAFALAFLFEGEEDLLIGARKGSPLAVGYGEGEMYLGSDAIALAPFTDTITYLEDGDWAVLTRNGVEVHDAKRQQGRARGAASRSASAFLVDKGNHRHFMAKEIHEQPEVVGHTLAHYLDMAAERVRLPATCRSISARSTACRSPPAAPPIMPGWSRNTGSSALRGCRSRSTSPPSSATARRRCAGRARDLRVAVGRDRRHARDAALRQGAEAARRSRSSTCRPRPSRAKATW